MLNDKSCRWRAASDPIPYKYDDTEYFASRLNRLNRRAKHCIVLLTVIVWGLGTQIGLQSASANTPLSRAVIQRLRNDVDLIPDGEIARPANIDDQMVPGDVLTTARASFAELRFNDGSLARVGERVLFRFVPETRTFRLNNGTMLLLIPPGQGRSRLQTPNATAGIRGSALFARYIPDTDTTLIGALTNSGIEVFNEDGTQHFELEAGHLAVFVEDRLERVYRMDLDRFYETSELTSGLNLGDADYDANRRPGSDSVAIVRMETIEAIESYTFDEGAEVIETPNFARMTATQEDLEAAGLAGGASVPNLSVPLPAQEQMGDRPSDVIDDVIDNAIDAGEIRETPANSRPSNRPSDRSNTPPGNRPNDRPNDRPSNRPDTPGNRPETPPGQDGRNPGNRPETPPGQDGRNPGNRPAIPPGQDR